MTFLVDQMISRNIHLQPNDIMPDVAKLEERESNLYLSKTVIYSFHVMPTGGHVGDQNNSLSHLWELNFIYFCANYAKKGH